jgi:methanogenic corrinoid protein MtbC1
MVEIALREAGWDAQSYGSSHPLETLAAAVREQRLRLFWLSLSWVGDRAGVAAAVETLHEAASEAGTALVLGGRALTASLRKRLRASAFCDDLGQLQDLAAALAR